LTADSANQVIRLYQANSDAQQLPKADIPQSEHEAEYSQRREEVPRKRAILSAQKQSTGTANTSALRPL
jgi:hypothetical protein